MASGFHGNHGPLVIPVVGTEKTPWFLYSPIGIPRTNSHGHHCGFHQMFVICGCWWCDCRLFFMFGKGLSSEITMEIPIWWFPNHAFCYWIFHSKPSSYWGSLMLGTLKMTGVPAVTPGWDRIRRQDIRTHGHSRSSSSVASSKAICRRQRNWFLYVFCCVRVGVESCRVT